MTALLDALPQLGVGVASVAALVYVVKVFMDKLDEREKAMRTLEYDIRNNIAGHLMASSAQMAENSRIMERVIAYLSNAQK